MSHKSIANIIFILALFPYISPFNTPFDIQPWALITVIIYVTIYILLSKESFSMPYPFWILFFVTIYALFFYLFLLLVNIANPLNGLRSFVGYLSISLFAFTSFKTYKYISVKPFIISVTIWFLVGIVQYIYGPMVTDWIVPRIGSAASWGYRGASSLATEPADYARMCLFFFIFNELFFRERKYGKFLYIVIFIALIFQIILSFSGTGILFIGLIGIYKFLEFILNFNKIKHRVLTFMIIISIIFAVYIFVKIPLFQRYRAGDLINKAIKDPISLIIKDPAVSLRVFNPVIAFYGGLIESYGIGFGLGTAEERMLPEWLGFWLGEERLWGGRILGGLVAAVYEIGIVGLLFVIEFLLILFRSVYYNRNFIRSALIFSSILLLFSSFAFASMAFPLLGYLLGIHLFYAYKNKKRRKKT